MSGRQRRSQCVHGKLAVTPCFYYFILFLCNCRALDSFQRISNLCAVSSIVKRPPVRSKSIFVRFSQARIGLATMRNRVTTDHHVCGRLYEIILTSLAIHIYDGSRQHHDVGCARYIPAIPLHNASTTQ